MYHFSYKLSNNLVHISGLILSVWYDLSRRGISRVYTVSQTGNTASVFFLWECSHNLQIPPPASQTSQTREIICRAVRVVRIQRGLVNGNRLLDGSSPTVIRSMKCNQFRVSNCSSVLALWSIWKLDPTQTISTLSLSVKTSRERQIKVLLFIKYIWHFLTFPII